jgi:hypothetical protein
MSGTDRGEMMHEAVSAAPKARSELAGVPSVKPAGYPGR